MKQTRVWTLPNKLESRCSLHLWCCVGERGIVALMRVSFVTALPQCLSAPTLSWSCRGTAFPSRACASLCTRCSAGKSTQSSIASSWERGTLMCARRSWAPFGFSPSTCITPSSLTGKILLMPFSRCSGYSLHSAACLNSVNTTILLHHPWIIYPALQDHTFTEILIGLPEVKRGAVNPTGFVIMINESRSTVRIISFFLCLENFCSRPEQRSLRYCESFLTLWYVTSFPELCGAKKSTAVP